MRPGGPTVGSSSAQVRAQDGTFGRVALRGR